MAQKYYVRTFIDQPYVLISNDTREVASEAFETLKLADCECNRRNRK